MFRQGLKLPRERICCTEEGVPAQRPRAKEGHPIRQLRLVASRWARRRLHWSDHSAATVTRRYIEQRDRWIGTAPSPMSPIMLNRLKRHWNRARTQV